MPLNFHIDKTSATELLKTPATGEGAGGNCRNLKEPTEQKVTLWDGQ